MTPRSSSPLAVAAIALASGAQAQCDLAIGWRHDGQIVRTPGCEDMRVTRMPGQSELSYTQSTRFDLRFRIDHSATEADVSAWLTTFCKDLNDGRVDYERRSQSPGKDTVFFRCSEL
ncbi:MAG: hypothetical protein AAGA87_13865 [Pseudomonadota bacterium]